MARKDKINSFKIISKELHTPKSWRNCILR